jgi:hypothetical protein
MLIPRCRNQTVTVVPKRTLVSPGLIPFGRGIPTATTEGVASGFAHKGKH